MANTPPVVDAAWLAQRLDDVVVVDVRWSLEGGARAGWNSYLEGHIPGASFVDLDRDLAAGRGAAGRHPLPDEQRFAGAMQRAGIDDDDTVVAYDDAGGAHAARLVWMLRVTGHDAAVLDGGIQAWKGRLSEAATVRPHGAFTPRPWPRQRIADIDDVERLRAADGAVVIDARAAERFRGEHEPVDAKAGHVPGAVNVPFAENLDARGRMRSPRELRDRYAGIGATEADEVVVYCGSGVTSCLTLLALEHAGVEGARLYPGSWSEWSRDAERPVATVET